jgi:hypothetical protein
MFGDQPVTFFDFIHKGLKGGCQLDGVNLMPTGRAYRFKRFERFAAMRAFADFPGVCLQPLDGTGRRRPCRRPARVAKFSFINDPDAATGAKRHSTFPSLYTRRAGRCRGWVILLV